MIPTWGPDGTVLVELDAYIGDPSAPPADPTARSEASAPEADALPVTPPDGSGMTTLAYSAAGWVGEADDAVKAHVPYWPRVRVGLRYERTLPLQPTTRRMAMQLGVIELDNGDGALDGTIASAHVGGRPVRILYGPKYREGGAHPFQRAAYSAFSPVLAATAQRWMAARDTVSVEIADVGVLLDGPAHVLTYDGGGGLGGDAALAGQRKPLTFGRCGNVPAVLLDQAHGIYQVHARRVLAVDAVRDKGVVLTIDGTVGAGGDVADLAALRVAPVAASAYATCLAEGLVRLGSTPAGTVTCDVRGDAQGGYVDSHGAVALRFLADFHGITNVDAGAFAALPAGEMGLHIEAGDTATGADVMDMLLGSVLGWWGGDRAGLITCGRLAPPVAAAAVAVYGERDILDLEPVPDDAPTLWRQGATWRRNWRPMSDVAAGLSAAQQQDLAQPYRLAVAADPAIQVRTLAATEGEPVVTLFEQAADAEAVAQRALALFGPRRGLFRARLPWYGRHHDLGAVVRVTWGRHGLVDRPLAIIGTTEDDAANAFDLLLWG